MLIAFLVGGCYEGGRNVSWPYALTGLFLVSLLAMLLMDIYFGWRLLRETGTFTMSMSVFIPCMFILLGWRFALSGR